MASHLDEVSSEKSGEDPSCCVLQLWLAWQASPKSSAKTFATLRPLTHEELEPYKFAPTVVNDIVVLILLYVQRAGGEVEDNLSCCIVARQRSVAHLSLSAMKTCSKLNEIHWCDCPCTSPYTLTRIRDFHNRIILQTHAFFRLTMKNITLWYEPDHGVGAIQSYWCLHGGHRGFPLRLDEQESFVHISIWRLNRVMRLLNMYTYT